MVDALFTLELKSPLLLPWECESLRPDRLSGLSSVKVAQLPLRVGNRQECLGDHFSIKNHSQGSTLVLQGDLSRGRGLGQGMESGDLLIEGNAGPRLGAFLKGGSIEVRGDVGVNCGVEMSAGVIRIQGDADDNLGGALSGSRAGMKGGSILLEGDAGSNVGFLMRRGLIAIRGKTGEFAGRAMIAGSIFVLGSVGARAGAMMKRGTIVAYGGCSEVLPTFRSSSPVASTRSQTPFLMIYLKELSRLGFPFPESVSDGPMKLWRGDLAEDGLGELWVR